MIKQTDFATIDLETLHSINGGSDFWDACKGAFRIVSSPVRAVVRGTAETIGSLQQGHSWGDSFASGLVQGAGLNEPKLSTIPNPHK